MRHSMLVFALLAVSAQAAETGEAVYQQACSECHEGQVAKAPHKMFLQMLAPDSIYKSMNEGIMMAQAEALSDERDSAPPGDET